MALLKKVLTAWRNEVEKQPSSMSVDDAFKELGLDQDVRHDDAKIRKTYFKLAQKYHPDKNPDGRVCMIILDISFDVCFVTVKLLHC